MKKRWLSIALAAVMVFSLAACGKTEQSAGTSTPAASESTAQETASSAVKETPAASTASAEESAATASETSSEEPAEETTSEVSAEEPADTTSEEVAEGGEEDGQNPIMNFVGPYGAYRASAFVEAEGMEGARVTVEWASSAAERSTWEMTGVLDPETLTMEYDNCRKVDQVFNEDGEVGSETVVYENGKGRIIFAADGTFTWEDDEENIAEGTVFSFNSGITEDPEVAAAVKASDFIGIWECDRCSIEICEDPEDGYRVLVGWGSSAFERTVWEYQCFYDDIGLYSFENGTKQNLISNEDGEMEIEALFNDGAARFDIDANGLLTWSEYKEDSGEGMLFEHVEPMTPTKEDFADDYFKAVGAFEAGTAGASLKQAEACDAVMRFAAGNALWAVNVPNMRDNMLAAWESLSDEERQSFDANFMDIVTMMDAAIADWDGNKGTFEDAGVAGNMEIFIEDPEAIASWNRLKSHTLTMGNSEE